MRWLIATADVCCAQVKKDFISLKCKACGEVSDVDMRHKLNTYILKNPPEEKVSKAEKKCAPT